MGRFVYAHSGDAHSGALTTCPPLNDDGLVLHQRAAPWPHHPGHEALHPPHVVRCGDLQLLLHHAAPVPSALHHCRAQLRFGVGLREGTAVCQQRDINKKQFGLGTIAHGLSYAVDLALQVQQRQDPSLTQVRRNGSQAGHNLGTYCTKFVKAHTPGTNSPESMFLRRRLTAVVASTWGSRPAPLMGAWAMSTLMCWLPRSQGAWGQADRQIRARQLQVHGCTGHDSTDILLETSSDVATSDGADQRHTHMPTMTG
jgi:hypothetical protein